MSPEFRKTCASVNGEKNGPSNSPLLANFRASERRLVACLLPHDWAAAV